MDTSTWCNTCDTCMSRGCDDSCGMAGGMLIILFVIVLAVMAGITTCVGIGSMCFATRRQLLNSNDVIRRGFGLVALVCAGCAMVYSLMFALYEAPQTTSLPPCTKSRHDLGIWFSAVGRDTLDYLAVCPGTQAVFRSLRGLSVFAILSMLSCFGVTMAVPQHWPAGVLGLVSAIFVSAVLGVNRAQIWGTSNFCDSHYSLKSLGYTVQSGENGLIAALVFVILGGVVQPLVMHLLKMNPTASARRHAFVNQLASASRPQVQYVTVAQSTDDEV
jgi:hypothetical protein